MAYYPDARNPREVRSYLHGVYDGYVVGKDRFPRKRIAVAIEALPRRTQAVATLINEAWQVIDQDRACFQAGIIAIHDSLTRTQAGPDEHGFVATRIGRNAVDTARIYAAPENRLELWRFDLPEFLSFYNGHRIRQSDGNIVSINDGEVEGGMDGFVVRPTGVAGIIGPTPEEADTIMADVVRRSAEIYDMNPARHILKS